MKTPFALLLTFLSALSLSGRADAASAYAGERLALEADSRALALGSAYVALAEGATAGYWNPAAMTQFDGKAFESDMAGILPHASHSYSASFLAAALGGLIPAYTQGVGNSGNTALLPSLYASWQLTPQLWAGLSVNAPFGLGVSFPTAWAGAGYGQNSDLKTYNVSPSLAYKINDMISIAFGVQVQYMDVSYNALATPATLGTAVIKGDGYSYGYTLGATITPTPTTKIGVGYRSALNQKIDGTLTTAVAGSTPGGVNVGLNLPALLSVGLRQGIGDRFTLLAGVEWQNWSRIGTAYLYTSGGAAATIAGSVVTFPFQYSDSWFYSLGGEYAVDPALKFRAGIAFEKSPITDRVRTTRLPDNDRMWYSVGASYKHPQFKGLSYDGGYSFIQVKDAPINTTAASGNPWRNGTGDYVGSVSSYIHILSLAVRYQWDDAAPAPAKKLITK